MRMKELYKYHTMKSKIVVGLCGNIVHIRDETKDYVILKIHACDFWDLAETILRQVKPMETTSGIFRRKLEALSMPYLRSIIDETMKKTKEVE